MDQRSCGCCNRVFEVSKLKLHAVRASNTGLHSKGLTQGKPLSQRCSIAQVGGGVREENELLCADCWAIFASESWEAAAAPAPLPGGSWPQMPASEPNGAGVPQSRVPQAASLHDGAHADPASQQQHRQAIDSRAESLGVIKRLSGGGEWRRPAAPNRLQLSSRESLGSAGLELPVGNGDSIPASRPGQDGPAKLDGKGSGPVLKRGRSGRFVSTKPASPASAGDALMQDLLSSQAHLFQQPQQPGELASKVLHAAAGTSTA